MQTHATGAAGRAGSPVWNHGYKIGPKRALKPKGGFGRSASSWAAAPALATGPYSTSPSTASCAAATW